MIAINCGVDAFLFFCVIIGKRSYIRHRKHNSTKFYILRSFSHDDTECLSLTVVSENHRLMKCQKARPACRSRRRCENALEDVSVRCDWTDNSRSKTYIIYIYFFHCSSSTPSTLDKEKKSFLDANDAGQSFGLGCIK